MLLIIIIVWCLNTVHRTVQQGEGFRWTEGWLKSNGWFYAADRISNRH